MSAKHIQSFGKHINKLREDRNLSFQELANACDMDKAQIYKICTQGVDVRFSTIIKLAGGLKISEKELFDFKR